MHKEYMTGDNPESVFVAICEALFVSNTMSSPVNDILRNLDPLAVVHTTVALVKCCTNPNIYTIACSNIGNEGRFDLATLFGILIFQEIFMSSFVLRETRVYLNNHIVRFILTFFPNQTVLKVQQLRFASISVSEWYNTFGRLPVLLEYFGVFPEQVRNFLMAYMRFAGNVRVDLTPYANEDSTLTRPYAGARNIGDFATYQFFNVNRPTQFGIHMIHPIIPYDFDEIINWAGEGLQQKLLTMCEMIAISNSTARGLARRVYGAFSDGPSRLREIFMSVVNRAPLVAASPYSHNRLDNPHEHTRIILMLDLSKMLSNIVFPSVLTEQEPMFQSPSIDVDAPLQTSLPILAYIKKKRI